MADYKAAASYPRFAGKCGVSCHQGTPKESLPLSYFKHQGLSIGDSWNVTQYMLWIDQKHDEFRRIRHLPEHVSLNNIEIHDFLHFINTDLKQEVF